MGMSGGDGVEQGALAMAWDEVLTELATLVRARVATAVHGDVELLGLRLIDSAGVDVAATWTGSTLIAGYRRTGDR